MSDQTASDQAASDQAASDQAASAEFDPGQIAKLRTVESQRATAAKSPDLPPIVILGAGAAGMMAAIAATEYLRARSIDQPVILLEKNWKTGVKILMSGGTRCNVTHNTDARGIAAEFGHAQRFLQPSVGSLPPADIVRWFADRGVATKVESTGKVFPVSNSAVDVRDALEAAVVQGGVDLRLGTTVIDVVRTGNHTTPWRVVIDQTATRQKITGRSETLPATGLRDNNLPKNARSTTIQRRPTEPSTNRTKSSWPEPGGDNPTCKNQDFTSPGGSYRHFGHHDIDQLGDGGVSSLDDARLHSNGPGTLTGDHWTTRSAKEIDAVPFKNDEGCLHAKIALLGPIKLLRMISGSVPGQSDRREVDRQIARLGYFTAPHTNYLGTVPMLSDPRGTVPRNPDLGGTDLPQNGTLGTVPPRLNPRTGVWKTPRLSNFEELCLAGSGTVPTAEPETFSVRKITDGWLGSHPFGDPECSARPTGDDGADGADRDDGDDGDDAGPPSRGFGPEESCLPNVGGRQYIDAAAVIVTAGGRSWPACGTTGDAYTWLEKLGHSIMPTRPALVPLVGGTPWMTRLSGLTLPDVAASVVKTDLANFPKRLRRRIQSQPKNVLAYRRSALLWTHFGFSGPAAMDVSGTMTAASVIADCELRLDLVPDQDQDSLNNRLMSGGGVPGRTLVSTIVADWLPNRLAQSIVAEAGGDGPLAEFTSDRRRRLIGLLKSLHAPVSGTRGFAKAEVTGGGVSLDEIDRHTMLSRLHPGLYVAGEVLDVDGPIGGFNFQAAFATGHAAGLAAARLSG